VKEEEKRMQLGLIEKVMRMVQRRKEKAAWEYAEMDPEIQHLIETIWEVDNCPPMLTGQITLLIKPLRPKLQRVYKIQDLMPRTHQGSSSSL